VRVHEKASIAEKDMHINFERDELIAELRGVVRRK
jgi:hypothetical protein